MFPILGHKKEPVTVASWKSLTLQVNHHHLLLVLDLAKVLRLFLLFGQLGGHFADPVLQQLLLLLGKIEVWVRLEALRHTIIIRR